MWGSAGTTSRAPSRRRSYDAAWMPGTPTRLHFVTPSVPPVDTLTGKELYPGDVSEEGYDTLPDFIGLAGVLSTWRDDDGRHTVAYGLETTPYTHKTHLAVALGIVSHAEKWLSVDGVGLDPAETECLIREPPSVEETYLLVEIGEGAPEEECTVVVRDRRNG